MSNGLPAFLITVDTEGDNLWKQPRVVTTNNSAFIARFQWLCEEFGFKPTYLTNWEMANDPRFVQFARDALSRQAAEVGMHLHAWNSPPIVSLTEDDDKYAPYLIEYPLGKIRDKVRMMTEKLENVFQRKMRSHRAGRWGFDKIYAQVLLDFGYQVDCSVTPLLSWKFCKGNPAGSGGTDYTRFPQKPYRIDLADVSRPGDSGLLELPLSVMRTRNWPAVVDLARSICDRSFYGTVLLRKLFPYFAIMMPNGRNIQSMIQIVQKAVAENWPYVEFAIHSSELMPGGSPTFPDAPAIDQLYTDLRSLFSEIRGRFQGMTLSEFHDVWIAQNG